MVVFFVVGSPLEMVTGDAALKGFYGNQWALQFKAGSGLSWDRLVYLSRQNYEQAGSNDLAGSLGLHPRVIMLLLQPALPSLLLGRVNSAETPEFSVLRSYLEHSGR
ncbi:hypothetical protein PA6_005_02130 [Aquipseudomonas alcaligenes NBRC 14159]|uniref:Uncharacterized protein n=1 Tax=Aquipseudomonas alcaligenes (strain ATCC 14909 / DSM 50342 / CCUG 1425 / JCM 20561 / NBRC 14159 / NCIMB 9945 / NCTC 10367 / 1577) TaxID=1215092 RepID=U3AUJ0_AQUA1|nr:hypothetical protein PA6_005_02130 [Pseudomonas alcaligenes NBRC 14159]